jgi:hypothetical protein
MHARGLVCPSGRADYMRTSAWLGLVLRPRGSNSRPRGPPALRPNSIMAAMTRLACWNHSGAVIGCASWLCADVSNSPRARSQSEKYFCSTNRVCSVRRGCGASPLPRSIAFAAKRTRRADDCSRRSSVATGLRARRQRGKCRFARARVLHIPPFPETAPLRRSATVLTSATPIGSRALSAARANPRSLARACDAISTSSASRKANRFSAKPQGRRG